MADKFLGLGWKGWVVIIVIGSLVLNVGPLPGIIYPYLKIPQSNPPSQTTVTVNTGGQTQGPPPVQVGSLQLLIGAYDQISGGALTSSTNVDVIPYSNLGTKSENLAISSAATNTVGYYPPNTDWYLHLYSTAGNKYTDRWFHAHIPDSSGNGGTISQLTVTTPACSATSATIVEKSIGTIGKAGAQGQTSYWQIVLTASGGGQLPLQNLETAANTNFNILDPTGTSMNKGTGTGTQNAGGETTSVTFFKNTGATNYTAAAKQVQFSLLISLADVSVVFGEPMVLVSSQAPYVLQARIAAVWFSVNSTSISAAYTQGQGWCALPGGNTPGFTSFYKFIDPVASTVANTGFASINIPIDTTAIAASTKLGVGIYSGNIQLPSDVAQGTADGAPTAYGGETAVGPSAIIGKTYSTNSSNQPGLSEVHFRFQTF